MADKRTTDQDEPMNPPADEQIRGVGDDEFEDTDLDEDEDDEEGSTI